MSGTKPHKVMCHVTATDESKIHQHLSFYLSISYPCLITKWIFYVLEAQKMSVYHLRQFMCLRPGGRVHTENIQSFTID